MCVRSSNLFPPLALPCFFFVFSIYFSSSLLHAHQLSSIYDYLQAYGLPIGLLPKNISKYSFDPETGQFQVFLDQACNAKFEDEVHYDFNVSGRLSDGQIADLAGISSQELFLWFPVKGIRVDLPTTGVIHFDVGVVQKQFSLSLFESPPDCTAADPIDPSYSTVGTLGYGGGALSKNEAQNVELADSGSSSKLKAAS